MQSVYMNVRCKEILQILLKSESHIPLHKISEVAILVIFVDEIMGDGNH